MIRRKLTLYTLLYIAGIAAGYFYYDKSRPAEAAGFALSVFLLVILAAPGHSATAAHSNGAAGSDAQGCFTRQKCLLLILFITGFAVFALRSSYYDRALAGAAESDAVTGRVVSVSVRENRIDMTLKSEGEKQLKKVLLTLDEYAAGRLQDSGKMPEDGPYGFIGTVIEGRGEFREFEAADDPGCFDYRLYMRSRGVSARFSAFTIDIIDPGSGCTARAKRFLISTRESFLERFDEDTRGFIRGVIFGDKSEIDEEVLDEFNENSTGHILAVSGLHIGFLYGLLRALTSRKRTRAASVLIITLILLYGEMTLWSPATVRACLVMAVSLCAVHLRRRADLLTSVSLAASVILTCEPYQLFSSGFQMSFLAICGIAFFTKPLSSVAGQTLGTMLAVQLGTLPVTAYSFCRIDPLALLINLPIIMLASVLVPLCILLLMAEAVFGAVPMAGIILAELLSYAAVGINHLLNFGGSFSIKTGGPGAAAMIAFYLTAFLLSSEWTRVMLLRKDRRELLKMGALILMPLMMLSACLSEPLYDDEITFVAVGQGDCVHVRASGHDLLIDGGGSDKYNVGKNILMPYLLHGGADCVDMALVTHLHSDHYKGISELSEIYPVGAEGIPYDYRNDHADDPGDTGPKIFYIKPETRIDIEEDIYVDTVWPVETSSDPLASDDPNEHNTVYMIHFKGIKVMVTGDLLEEDELEMVKQYEGTDTLKCDVLKVAHHGSKSSSSEAFLDAASPSIAVIQCGRNNIYGHPHKQTLERLEERGISVFRTDQSGAVGIDIHGKKINVDLFR